MRRYVDRAEPKEVRRSVDARAPRADPMDARRSPPGVFSDASDVLVVVDAASSRGFPADGLRTFMRDFPEQTFHVLVALEAPDAAVDEAVADVAMAATGSIFYVAPPGEDEVEAPAPAAPEKDFGPETLSEGQLADMFDSI